MKTLLFPLLALIAISCSKPDKEEPVDPNAPTSFVFYYDADVDTMKNCIAGYYVDGLCKKLGDLGDMVQNEHSNEIFVDNDTLVNVYFFTDYAAWVDHGEANRLKDVYKLQRGRKNIFYIKESTAGEMVDRNDPSQYPE